MHYLASKLSDKTWIGEENALQEKVHYVPGKVSEWNENLVFPDLPSKRAKKSKKYGLFI